MKRLKSEKGVITLITLVTILFMISFLISSYVIVANKVKTQKEILNDTKKIYEPKLTMEEIYNSYFSNDDTIPIYTVEQLLAMGNNEKININGKIYTFSDTVGYILMSDLEFNADEWQHILGQNTDWTPIEETNLVFDWNGHTITVTKLDGTTVTYGVVELEEKSLPSEYQEVEYIESTGTQYIDTGMKLNQNSTVELQTQVTESGDYNIFGSRSSASENNIGIIFTTTYNETLVDFQNYNINRLSVKNPELIRTLYKISNTQLQIGNTTKDISNYTDFTTPENAYIFDMSGNKPNNAAKMKLYYCKIWDGDTLVRDFVPCCRKSDNKPGLYDLVNDVFYTNQGEGEFIAGAEI